MKSYGAAGSSATVSKLRGLRQRVKAGDECIARLLREITGLKGDRLLLAKLAADAPQFSNPLEIAAARRLRDGVLGRGWCAGSRSL